MIEASELSLVCGVASAIMDCALGDSSIGRAAAFGAEG